MQRPARPAAAPEGAYTDRNNRNLLGVCWIYGRDLGEILGFSGQAEGKLIQAGMEIVDEECGLFWCFERYGCPRYTTPDEQGNITLDYCYFVK